MKPTNLVAILLAIPVSITCSERVLGDAFGSGPNTFDINFVTIGIPGNAADTTGDPNPAGSVPYMFRMGQFEISEQMIDKANTLGGLGITKEIRSPDKPATSVTWNEAASDGSQVIGFRVASIPEPSTMLLGALATVGVFVRRRG